MRARNEPIEMNHSRKSIKGFSKEYLKEITKLVTSALTKHSKESRFPVTPILQGSAGLLLLGVDYKPEQMPDDIDILVDNPLVAHEIMQHLAQKLKEQVSPYEIKLKPASAQLVLDYQLIDTTGQNPQLTVQLLEKHSWGLSEVTPILVDDIPVLSPKDALTSLSTRIRDRGVRPKDQYAYYSLLDKYGEDYVLAPDFIETGKDLAIKTYLKLTVEEKQILKDATTDLPAAQIKPAPHLSEVEKRRSSRIVSRGGSSSTLYSRSRDISNVSGLVKSRQSSIHHESMIRTKRDASSAQIAPCEFRLFKSNKEMPELENIVDENKVNAQHSV